MQTGVIWQIINYVYCNQKQWHKKSAKSVQRSRDLSIDACK